MGYDILFKISIKEVEVGEHNEREISIADNKSAILFRFALLSPAGGGNSPVIISRKSELQYFRDVFYMS